MHPGQWPEAAGREDYSTSQAACLMASSFFICEVCMSKLRDNIARLDRHIKKQHPGASTELWNLYHEALDNSSTPTDFDAVQNWSLGDLFEFTAHNQPNFDNQKRDINQGIKNQVINKDKNLGGRPADEKGYKAAFQYMVENKCSPDESYSWWKIEFREQAILRSYTDTRKLFNKGLNYWLNKSKT